MKAKNNVDTKVKNKKKCWHAPKIESLSVETVRPNFLACAKGTWFSCLSWSTDS